MSYISLKDQIDVSFKIGDQIDRYWQMFINANFVVAIALGSTFISKATSGHQAVELMGKSFTLAFILKVMIVLFFYLFIVMNFRALREAYRGFDLIIADIKAELKQLEGSEESIASRHFVKWINSFDYSDRLYLLMCIFGYSVASVTAVVLVFAPYTSGEVAP